MHPGIVVAFGIFAVTALLAVHVFLFRSTRTNHLHIPSPIPSATETDPSTATSIQPPPPPLPLPLSAVSLTPLRPLDREQYTVRINTWKRPDQLRLALDHYVTCDAVAQIQVVWCTAQGDPPGWLLEYERGSGAQHQHGPVVAVADPVVAVADPLVAVADPVAVVVEAHAENTLNERFRLLTEPATAGILTVDDDVLRPCIAVDAGFVKWTAHPDRMVGFDARGHGIVANKSNSKSNDDDDATKQHWAYSYLSTTEKSNLYSLTLTRFAFIHRDYMDSYFTHMPVSIRNRISQELNCEDVAMSFWVSAMTGGQAPLLADLWAIKSQIKLYSPSTISSTSNHKIVRNQCVNDFANILDLKGRLSLTPWVHRDELADGLFECGADSTELNYEHVQSQRQVAVQQQVQEWKQMERDAVLDELGNLRQEMSHAAFEQGFLVGSRPWKKRFRSSPEQ